MPEELDHKTDELIKQLQQVLSAGHQLVNPVGKGQKQVCDVANRARVNRLRVGAVNENIRNLIASLEL